MNYIDGFVAAVPTANRAAYIEHAEKMAVVFKEFGAVSVVECWGDDVPEGKLTSFTMAVKREADEAVVRTWVGNGADKGVFQPVHDESSSVGGWGLRKKGTRRRARRRACQ